MYVCLVIAIFATILWLNVTIAEINTTRLNPYAKSIEDEDMKRNAEVKTVLAIIMALFWAAVIRYL